jgi:hypothetical protein
MPRILLVALAAATFAAAPSTASAVPTTLQVALVGGGSLTYSPDPLPSTDPDACSGTPVASSREELSQCTLAYEAGTAVTLTAEGAPPDGLGDNTATSLARWSDARCSAPDPCTLVLGTERETVAAMFTPQRVSAAVVGTGAVSVEEANGVQRDLQTGCNGPPADARCADVALGDVVSMLASPSPPGDPVTWAERADGADLTFCDEPQPPPCHLTADRPRWISVAFGAGASPETSAIPPEIRVNFRIRKAGSGSGTVRSPGIDCGTDCSDDRKFGEKQTFTAEPDSGARFDHWVGGCGASPQCSLAVGPVTALTAVFERGGAAGGGSQQQQQQSTRPRLSARVLRLKVTGHGRKRTIFVRLRVNVASTVRAVLLRGRKRVATRSFRVKAGTPLVRFRVPARTRAGTYRLRLTIKGNGQTRQLTRRVRLPR